MSLATNTHTIGQTTFSQLGPRNSRMERVFDAPRELVWEVITRPEHIARWWGQDAADTFVDQLDLQVGGGWRFRQVTADGQEWAFRGEFTEITPPETLVMTFEFEGMPGKIVTDHHALTDLGQQTRITSTSTFLTAEDLDGMMASGMEAGANESWDRMARLLAELQATS